jgi:hypothetical protein
VLNLESGRLGYARVAQTALIAVGKPGAATATLGEALPSMRSYVGDCVRHTHEFLLDDVDLSRLECGSRFLILDGADWKIAGAWPANCSSSP